MCFVFVFVALLEYAAVNYTYWGARTKKKSERDKYNASIDDEPMTAAGYAAARGPYSSASPSFTTTTRSASAAALASRRPRHPLNKNNNNSPFHDNEYFYADVRSLSLCFICHSLFNFKYLPFFSFHVKPWNCSRSDSGSSMLSSDKRDGPSCGPVWVPNSVATNFHPHAGVRRLRRRRWTATERGSRSDCRRSDCPRLRT